MRGSRNTECGAKKLLVRLEVRTAPFGLLRNLSGTTEPAAAGLQGVPDPGESRDGPMPLVRNGAIGRAIDPVSGGRALDYVFLLDVLDVQGVALRRSDDFIPDLGILLGEGRG